MTVCTLEREPSQTPCPLTAAPPLAAPLVKSNFLSVRHGPFGPPTEHENGGVPGSRRLDLGVRNPTGSQAELLWCFEPVYQSGPDLASNHRLLPAVVVAEHAEQIAFSFEVHRDRAAREAFDGYHVSLLCGIGCA